MTSYTVDSIALVHYLLDILPERAQAVVERAENGDATLELPAIVLTETSYILHKRDEIRGLDVRDVATSEDVQAVLTKIERESPIELVPTDYDDLQYVATHLDEFSIHDALVVASHESRDTEAILTKDGTIVESDVATLWQ